MAKLGTYTNPLNGQKGNIFSLSDWAGGILGVVAVLIMVSTGQRMINAVEKRAPMIDGTPDRLFKDQTPAIVNRKEVF